MPVAKRRVIPEIDARMENAPSLPDELLELTLNKAFPCRERQVRALSVLLHPKAAPCRNIVIYGPESTGKSAIIESLLSTVVETSPDDAAFALVNSRECITARHLFETTLSRVISAGPGPGLSRDGASSRCETVSNLTVQLSKLLNRELHPDHPKRFILVFDGIDRQRDAGPTLLPALARLSELIPNLTTVFVVTSPPPSFLRTTAPHVEFPNYTKTEFVQILAERQPPLLPNTTSQDAEDLWARFCGAVHDALIKAACRTLPALERACTALWPRFTAPILAGTHTAREFSRLLIAARVHFQDESLLDHGVVRGSAREPKEDVEARQASPQKGDAVRNVDLSILLPVTARLLLLSAYLTSHNASKHDLTLFSTYHHGRKRRRGGLLAGGKSRGKHRKIARKLLGAHAFLLERLLAVFTVTRSEWLARSDNAGRPALDCDIGMAIATLSSLRLLVKVGGGGDPMDRGGKWKVNVGWEVIRGLGRSLGVEVEEWLID